MKGLPVLIGRKRLREVVTMTGITHAQQAELYDLALNMKDSNLDRLKELVALYQKQGAKFVYPDRKGNL